MGMITTTSILSQRTREGMVELTVNGERAQLDLPKAREVVGMLQGAIEAAATDQMIWKFFIEKVGVDENRAAQILLDFRELRQGSRNLVYPS